MWEGQNDSYNSPSTKINSRWIKNIKVGSEILKFLKEDRRMLQDIDIGNIFLARIPQTGNKSKKWQKLIMLN